MKIYSIVFLLILQSVSTFAQAPKKKIIGGMAENDSIWKIDVEMEVSAFVDLRLFLAEFQSENKATFLTKLDAGTVRKITELDSLYQNEVLLFFPPRQVTSPPTNSTPAPHQCLRPDANVQHGFGPTSYQNAGGRTIFCTKMQPIRA